MFLVTMLLVLDAAHVQLAKSCQPDRSEPALSQHCGLQLCTGTRNRALTWAHSFMSTWSLPKSDSHLVLTEVSMDAGVLPGCARDIAA
jgi:hypothetical protein